MIHLTTKDKDSLPEDFKQNLAIMRRFYPDHEIRIYDDADLDNFVSSAAPAYHKDVFRRLPSQIMRVDTVRYLWMQILGGLYFDFDIKLQRPWQPQEGAILVSREWTWPEASDIRVSVHNCVFASEPGHGLWSHLLEGIARQVKQYGSGSAKWPVVFDVTGPNAISRTISQGDLTQRLSSLHILEPSVIYQHGMSKHPREAAIFVHETAGSWNRPSYFLPGRLKRFGYSARKFLKSRV